MSEHSKQIIVVGMHRSGTSMVTRLLNMLGIFFGSPELCQAQSGGEENIKGFWEHPKLVEINRDIFSVLNMRWDRVSSFHHDQLCSQALDGVRSKALEFVHHMDHQGNWVAKDPRTCLTLSFWRTLLRRPIIVWVYRNPLEVARSLQRRNKFSLPYGLALWEKYMREALYATQGLPIVFINYHHVIENSFKATQQLLDDLHALGATGLSMPDTSLIKGFVDKRYFRERSKERELQDYLTQSQKLLNETVSSIDGVRTGFKIVSMDMSSDVLCFEEMRAHELELLEKVKDLLKAKDKQISVLESTVLDFENRLGQGQRSSGSENVDPVFIRMGKKPKGDRNSFEKMKSMIVDQHTRVMDYVESKRWRLKRKFEHLGLFNFSGMKSSKLGTGYNLENLPSKRVVSKSFIIDRISIIICIHNALDDVRNCLKSVIIHTDLNDHELIIVDDGSHTLTQEYVAKFCTTHNVQIIRNESAMGYTRAANQGLRAATGDALVLLNSDTIVSANWLHQLKEVAMIPGTACVGPLSNAASWQSIPDAKGEDGKWKVNEVPGNLNVHEFNATLKLNTRALNPKVSFVNGFCLMIHRSALEEVGYLDEECFPRGYGEEDDFVLRCLNKGFVNRIADHCYVYHAKSKSFTNKNRTILTHISSRALKDKHGKTHIQRTVTSHQHNEDLLRARVSASHAIQRAKHKSMVFPKVERALSIAWPQPHLKTVGGIRRVIEMTNRLVMMGHHVTIYTPSGKKSNWLPIHADVRSINQPETMPFDLVILSDPDNLEMVKTLPSKNMLIYHLAPYHLYRPESPELYGYYHQAECINIANSQWVSNSISKFYTTQAIFPGGMVFLGGWQDHT